MTRRTIISLTLVASAVLLVAFLTGCKRGTDASTTVASNPVEPVAVREVVVAASVIVDRVILPCSVEAFDEVKISAEVAGRITKLTHDEGQEVKAGEILFLCDTERLQADVDRAKAAFELAEASYQRIDALAKSKYGQATAEQVDRTLSERDVAKANLESTRILLDRAIIRSPLDGRIERRYVDVGEYVIAGTPVADVVRIDKLKVYVEVPEREVSYIEPGGQVMLHFKFDGEGDFQGIVDNIDRVGDPVTRTYRTRIIMDNSEMHIRPGMIGNTVLARGKPRQGISIPLDALIARKGRLYVVLNVDGKAVERDIERGVFDGQRIEIVKGLAIGDHLIVEGQRQVNEGDPVSVVDDQVPRQDSTATVAPKVTEGAHENQ